MKTVKLNNLQHRVTWWLALRQKGRCYISAVECGRGLKHTCIFGKMLAIEMMTQNIRLRLMKTLCSVQSSGVV